MASNRTLFDSSEAQSSGTVELRSTSADTQQEEETMRPSKCDFVTHNRMADHLAEPGDDDDPEGSEFSLEPIVSALNETKKKSAAKVASNGRKTTSASRRLGQARKQEKKRLKEERGQQQNEIEEEATRQRLAKPISDNERFKLQEKRNRLRYFLGSPLYSKLKHYPDNGEFGESVGFEGGNYIYRQHKRTYEAKVALATEDEHELGFDDSTDTDEEFLRSEERKFSNDAPHEPIPSTEGESAAQMSTEQFESSQEYLDWKHGD